MKLTNIFSKLVGFMAAMSLSATAASVTLEWTPSSEPEVISYNVYYKLSTANTWSTTNVVGRLNNKAVLPIDQFLLYQFYVTAIITHPSITGPLESDPSNQVRFQSFYVNGSRTTFLRISDVNTTNFAGFTLVTNVVRGALAGNPPALAFTPNTGFSVDSFVYKNPELFSGRNVTNYYSLEKVPLAPSTVNTLKYNN